MDLTKNYTHVRSVLMILLFLFVASAHRTTSPFFRNYRNRGISMRGLWMAGQSRFDCFRRRTACLLGNSWKITIILGGTVKSNQNQTDQNTEHKTSIWTSNESWMKFIVVFKLNK